jgi:hypothetical protein
MNKLYLWFCLISFYFVCCFSFSVWHFDIPNNSSIKPNNIIDEFIYEDIYEDVYDLSRTKTLIDFNDVAAVFIDKSKTLIEISNWFDDIEDGINEVLETYYNTQQYEVICKEHFYCD